jgi:hypothetical protein
VAAMLTIAVIPIIIPNTYIDIPVYSQAVPILSGRKIEYIHNMIAINAVNLLNVFSSSP